MIHTKTLKPPAPADAEPGGDCLSIAVLFLSYNSIPELLGSRRVSEISWPRGTGFPWMLPTAVTITVEYPRPGLLLFIVTWPQ
jgi:hypothetical protein